jgi:hypothetical protein
MFSTAFLARGCLAKLGKLTASDGRRAVAAGIWLSAAFFSIALSHVFHGTGAIICCSIGVVGLSAYFIYIQKRPEKKK